MGGAMFPPCSLACRCNGDLLQKDWCQHVTAPRTVVFMPLTPWQATVNPHIHRRLLDIHRQVWISLLWGHCSFLLGPGAHKVLFVPSKKSVSRYWGSSVIKFHWPSKSNSLRVLSPSARPPGSEICVGPRSFATVWELLWYNCSPICGSSAWELCDGANANFLRDDLCHMPRLPVCCSQTPCPCGRSLLTCASAF